MVYEDLIRGLNRKRIDYVIIGGLATVLHGVVRMTADIDFALAMDKSNLRHFISLMKELGYKPKAPVKPEQLLDPDMRQDWIDNKNMLVFSFYNPKNPVLLVDVLLSLPLDYAKIKKDAVRKKLGRLAMPIISKEDLISLKQHSGRVQDLADIEALKEL